MALLWRELHHQLGKLYDDVQLLTLLVGEVHKFFSEQLLSEYTEASQHIITVHELMEEAAVQNLRTDGSVGYLQPLLHHLISLSDGRHNAHYHLVANHH